MCRMIAVVGRFEMAPLLDGLRAMAANTNTASDHEFRERGAEFQHDCGWGAAWNEGSRLRSLVSPEFCVTDRDFDSLSSIKSDLAILHARRTPHRETIGERNSHPFTAERFGEIWGFCHNGSVNDVAQLGTHTTIDNPEPVDSELLFHFLLKRLDPSDPAASMRSALAGIGDFTCLNSFLFTSAAAYIYARVSPDTTRPLYYTLWLGRGDGFALASSEPLSLNGVEWTRMPHGSALRLTLDSPGH